jgi:hypothetical protein
MKTTEWDEPPASDPLAARLARIADPPVSKELMARVLSGTLSKRSRIRRTHVLVAIGLVAALATGLAATPAGAAVGSAVQQRFGIMSGTPQTLQHPGPNDCAIYAGAPNTTSRTFTKNGVTATEWSRPAPKSCKAPPGHILHSWDYKEPVFDLQRAQSLVSFRIRTATRLPAGLQLQGVGMEPNPPDFSTYSDHAWVRYWHPGSSNGPNLSISEEPGTPNGGSGVPSSSTHSVRVNGRPAVYVHGNYESKDPYGPAVWNPNADVSELSWQADGITYDLSAYHLRLSRAGVLRVAESVQ